MSIGCQDVKGLIDGEVAAEWCEVYSRSLSLACCKIWPSVQECFPSLRLLRLFHIVQLTIKNRVGSLLSAKIHPIKLMKFEHCLKLSWFHSGIWFHVSLNVGQRSRAWMKSSWKVLQTSHKTIVIICWHTRLVLGGKELLLASHSRFFTFPGKFKFQMAYRRGFKCSKVEGPGYWARNSSCKNLYPDLIEYSLAGLYGHVRISACGVLHRGIFFNRWSFKVQQTIFQNILPPALILLINKSTDYCIGVYMQIWWDNFWFLFHWKPIIMPNQNWVNGEVKKAREETQKMVILKGMVKVGI